MKKVTKVSAAAAIALSAVTPVAAFASESTLATGYYAETFTSLEAFKAMSSSQKKAFLLSNMEKTNFVYVYNGQVFDLTGTTGEKIMNASDEEVSKYAVTPAAYQTAKGVTISATGITKTPEAPVGELKVESVSAINAAQVKIVFSEKVDEDTATDLNNYYVGLTKDVDSKFVADLANTGYVATLLDDEKTVIISAADLTANSIWADVYNASTQAIKTDTASTPTVLLENRTLYVQIKDVKTADGKLASAIETSFVAKDSEGPKFAEASYSVDTVTTDPTIVFSEPVQITGLGAAGTQVAKFYLNGVDVTSAVSYKAVAPAAPETVKEYSELTLDVSAIAAGFELNEGNNKFEVVGLEDLVGNSTTPSRITTTIKVEEEVTVAPKVVGVQQAHDGAFIVLFDKAIAASTGTVTIKNNKNDGADYTLTLNDTTAGTVLVPTFGGTKTTANPNGYYGYLVTFDEDGTYTSLSDEVYQVANSVIRTVEVKDFQDVNKTKTGVKYTKASTFKKDIIAPTAVQASATTAAATSALAFVSGSLGSDSGDNILVSFKDEPFNGLTVAGSPTTDVVLKLVENGITHTATVTVASANFLQVENASGVATNNYVLDLEPSGLLVPFFNGSTLKSGIQVTLPYGLVTDDIADTTPQYAAAGFNFIGATLAVKGGSSAVVPATSQADVSYNAALNTVEVQFTGKDIDAATLTNKANYTFDGVSLANIAGATIEVDSNDLVSIQLPKNSVERNGNYNLVINNVATKSGAKMLPTTVVVYNVEDNTQPLVTAAKVTSDNTIEVTFDETLGDPTTFAAGSTPAGYTIVAGTPTLVTDGERNFKVIVGGATYNVSDVTVKNGTTVVLTTVDTFDYNKAVQVQLAPDASNDVFLFDIAGNKAATKTVTATKDIQ